MKANRRVVRAVTSGVAPAPPRGPTTARRAGGDSTATERYLARLGKRREEFLREHFAASWRSYDRLAALFTLGLIHTWRGRGVRLCDLRRGHRLLDVATGTGAVILRAAPRLGATGLAVGLDVSIEGLLKARDSAQSSRAWSRWIQATALPMPFRDQSFDAVVVGFALRHLGPPREVFGEFRRVLAPGGRLVILDFFRPRPSLSAWAGLRYLFWVVPIGAGLLSGRRAVYRLARYLPHSILDALGPEELVDELRGAGFAVEASSGLCAGIVWVFAATVAD